MQKKKARHRDSAHKVDTNNRPRQPFWGKNNRESTDTFIRHDMEKSLAKMGPKISITVSKPQISLIFPAPIKSLWLELTYKGYNSRRWLVKKFGHPKISFYGLLKTCGKTPTIWPHNDHVQVINLVRVNFVGWDAAHAYYLMLGDWESYCTFSVRSSFALWSLK